MNDDQFVDLAMKVIARQATEAERAELDALVARQPELKAEFERLQAEVRLAREVLPLVSATEATAPELPAYARGRLQTKVRETFGRPQAPEEDAVGTLWKWRWILGLAAATAVVVLFLLPVLSSSAPPMIQVAMLDTVGATRGSDTNEMSLLHQAWEKAAVDSFTGTEALHTWEENWPAQNRRPVVKVVFDRAAGEVRILGRWKGESFTKTLLVERDLAATLEQAKSFIKQRTSQ
jgi:anti-sigma-K factor RskA